MFWSKNKKKKYTPVNPSFTIIKVGCKGVFVTLTCFRDVPKSNSDFITDKKFARYNELASG